MHWKKRVLEQNYSCTNQSSLSNSNYTRTRTHTNKKIARAHTHTRVLYTKSKGFSQHITLLSRPPVFLPTQSVKTQPAGRLGKARFNSLSHQHNIVHVANPKPSHCSARIHARLQQGALSFDGNGEDSRKTAVRKKDRLYWPVRKGASTKGRHLAHCQVWQACDSFTTSSPPRAKDCRVHISMQSPQAFHHAPVNPLYINVLPSTVKKQNIHTLFSELPRSVMAAQLWRSQLGKTLLCYTFTQGTLLIILDSGPSVCVPVCHTEHKCKPFFFRLPVQHYSPEFWALRVSKLVRIYHQNGFRDGWVYPSPPAGTHSVVWKWVTHWEHVIEI